MSKRNSAKCRRINRHTFGASREFEPAVNRLRCLGNGGDLGVKCRNILKLLGRERRGDEGDGKDEMFHRGGLSNYGYFHPPSKRRAKPLPVRPKPVEPKATEGQRLSLPF